MDVLCLNLSDRMGDNDNEVRRDCGEKAPFAFTTDLISWGGGGGENQGPRETTAARGKQSWAMMRTEVIAGMNYDL